jgi:hypothetical protein
MNVRRGPKKILIVRYNLQEIMFFSLDVSLRLWR